MKKRQKCRFFCISRKKLLYLIIATKERMNAICPGSTETEFFNVVGADEASVGKRDTPDNVVQVALRSLQVKKIFAVPGFTNYISAQMSRFFTRKQMLSIDGRMLRPRH